MTTTFQKQLEVFADYHQFYVKDDDGGMDYGENWTRESTEKMILVGRRLIAFGTARDMNVPVLLEVHDVEADKDTESWEHVAEGSLEITSGRMVIAGCTDYEPDAMRIPVAHGYYRARLSSRGLKDLSPDGLDGNDTYRVQLWPEAAERPTLIIKHGIGEKNTRHAGGGF